MARILGVDLRHATMRACIALAFAWRAASAAPACPAPAPSVLVERYLSAACEACWARGDPPPPNAMVLDWIVPAQDDAPMAAAALAEAAARAPGLGPARTLTRDRLLPPASPLVLRVTDGPAINGYIGLQLRVTRPGRRLGLAVGYIALVERVPAGSDGTALPRQLVRALVGPLGLDELATRSSTTHRAATRLPETARPERLSAVAWVETPDGALLAATWAGSACRAR